MPLFDVWKNINFLRKPNLTEGLYQWIIHAVNELEHIGGFCLMIECPSVELKPDSKQVGVTFDLVPAQILKTTNQSLRTEANAFLPHTFHEYVFMGNLHRLIRKQKCDRKSNYEILT